MRGEIRFRDTAFFLFTLAVCALGCGRGGREGIEAQGGSPSPGWRGTGGGSGAAGVGGRAGAGGATGVAGAPGGSSGGGQAGGGEAGATGGVAGASGGDAGGSAGEAGGAGTSGGAAGASGGPAGSGGNRADSGIDVGRSAEPIGCAYCGPGTTCAYAIADGCNAVGTCVTKPAPSPCWAIVGAIACGCDGRLVEWEDGCMPDLPAGYAPAPVVHRGNCP
jgi:hypothetical protein